MEEWDNSYYDTLTIPTREGYTFKGYYTEKNGGTRFEMILNESGIDSDMTFYAHLEENVVETPATPTQPEISNTPTTPSTIEKIENPETGGTINIRIRLNFKIFLRPFYFVLHFQQI